MEHWSGGVMELWENKVISNPAFARVAMFPTWRNLLHYSKTSLLNCSITPLLNFAARLRP